MSIRTGLPAPATGARTGWPRRPCAPPELPNVGAPVRARRGT
jgi:hypothetical protein